MGSRPEVNEFIIRMTNANLQRMAKFNENRTIFNEEYGPFALCNRKKVTKNEQFEAQLKAYNELVHYAGKVSENIVLVRNTFYFLQVQIWIGTAWEYVSNYFA